jgi:UDP-N-acetyl-2-amino-2-deoxyglucuronate dehydrogenase
MEKVKFGLVGCGRIASRHAEGIIKNPRAELSYVCDIDKNRADYYAKEYDSVPLYDFNELLKKDIDVVNICTPNGLHAQMSIDSMLNGKNVLCEKPMTINLIDSDKVVQVERETGKNFFLVKQNRYNASIVKLKEIVSTGKMGDITFVGCNVYWNRSKDYYTKDAWKGTMKLDGGAIMTQFSHYLDLMLWIGGEVKSVNAKMTNLNHHYIETEDTGIVNLAFENGSFGSLQYTNCVYEKNYEGNMMVLGTNGTIKVGGPYLNKMEFWNVKDVPKPDIEEEVPLIPDENGNYKKSKSRHEDVIENVVSVLYDGGNIKTTSLAGRRSVEVMQGTYISAIEKRDVYFPLKEKSYNFKLDEQKTIFGFNKNV